MANPASPPPGGDIPEIAMALARGEPPERVLAGVPEAEREAVAAIARACGARLLTLEERAARQESTLREMRMAVRGYSRVKRELRAEAEGLKAEIDPGRRPIVGADGGLREVVRVVEKVRDTPIPVLITGESGTGKEVVARHIHEDGERAAGPFVALNCAALPEGVLEAELFGIDKGVATGVGARAGKLEEASGGTLFLDEVADMTLAVQAKILRALQEREVVRVGSTRPIPFDVRLISATNKDLRAEIAAGRFREDLYYRIVGVHIRIPALRERREDIGKLLGHFLAEAERRFGRPARRFDAEALRALETYSWPGNVRELIVEVERAVALAEGETIGVADLTPAIAAALRAPGAGGAEAGAAPAAGAAGRSPGAPGAPAGPVEPLKEARARFERAYVGDVLARAGSRRRAAKLLGITTEGLRKKLRALDLLPEAPGAAAE